MLPLRQGAEQRQLVKLAEIINIEEARVLQEEKLWEELYGRSLEADVATKKRYVHYGDLGFLV